MPAERYYLPLPLQCGDIVSLTDNEFHHLTNVMRAKAGDEIELVNGVGGLALGKITGLEKKRAVIAVIESSQQPKPAASLILAQGIPRINRLDYIVEKGTELGMSALWLFPGERSERKELTEHQLERSVAIAIAAMKQSGRLYLPEITLKPRLGLWEKPQGALFFGDVSLSAPPFKQLWQERPPEEMVFFVGPESGFTESEEEIMRGWHAHGVQLHTNTLRTDTAALAALSLASHWHL